MEFLPLAARHTLAVAWRKRWLLVAVGWAVCIVGWLIVSRIPDYFEAQARLYVDTDAVLTPLLRGLAVDTATASQLELMQRTLLSRPNLTKLIDMTDLGLTVDSASQKERLITTLAQQVKLSLDGRNLFSIQYGNRDPKLAHDVVQALLTIFMESTAGITRSDMDNARKFMREELATYEQQLRTAEERRAEFHKKYLDILPADGNGGRSRLDSAREQVTRLELDLQDATIKRDRLREALSATPPTVSVETVGGGATQSPAATQLLEAERNLALLRTKDTEANPDVIAARRLVETLRGLDGASGSEQHGPSGARMIVNPIYQQLKLRLVDAESAELSLENRLQSAQTDRNRLEEIARAVPGVEAKYANLDRDYSVLRSEYEALLARREAANISQAADTSADQVQLRIVDPPQIPLVPAGPNRLLLVSGVFIGALMTVGLLAVAFGQADRSIGHEHELREFDLPVLGTISIYQSASAFRLYAQAAGITAATLLLVAIYGGILVNGGLLVSSARMVL